MAYLPNIPAGTDNISTSQGQIQANFQAIDPGTSNTGIGLARDHVTMTDATNGGTHTKLTFLTAMSPEPVAPTNPVSYFYTKAGSGGVFTSYVLPFFRNQSAILSILPDLAVTSNATGNDYGFNFGNLIINFGNGTIVAGASTETRTFKIAFSTSGLMLQMTKRNDGMGSSANAATCSAKFSGTTQAIFNSESTLSSGNMPYYYLAIGY